VVVRPAKQVKVHVDQKVNDVQGEPRGMGFPHYALLISISPAEAEYDDDRCAQTIILSPLLLFGRLLSLGPTDQSGSSRPGAALIGIFLATARCLLGAHGQARHDQPVRKGGKASIALVRSCPPIGISSVRASDAESRPTKKPAFPPPGRHASTGRDTLSLSHASILECARVRESDGQKPIIMNRCSSKDGIDRLRNSQKIAQATSRLLKGVMRLLQALSLNLPSLYAS